MNTNYSKKWSLFVFSALLAIIAVYIGGDLLLLNTKIYNYYGDTFKNYYHIILASKANYSFIIDKVNYPFGEHIVYLDAQPLLVWFIKAFSLHDYIVGIINFLPILSIALCGIPVFLVQRFFKLPLVLNVISSILIALLAPQLERATGHFGLSYSFYIPTIYCVLLTTNWSWFTKYFISFILVIAFSFLHPYYLIIGVVLLLSFSFYHLFVLFNKRAFVFNISFALLALVVFKTIMFFTDSVKDRPENPYGMDVYSSNLQGIFFPKFKPFAELVKGFNVSLSFESNAYIGILGLPAIFIFVYFLLSKFSQKNSFHFKNQSTFIYLFISACFVWLFALYSPVKFILKPLQDLIPAFKQFRGLGRLGWIVYFIFSLTISRVVYVLFIKIFTKTKWAYLFLVLCYFLWFLDANANLSSFAKHFNKAHNYKSLTENIKQNSNKLNLAKYNFDAALALPIYHLGSEIENFEAHSFSYSRVFMIADELQIPIISTHSSRTSKKQFLAIKTLKENMDFSQIAPSNTSILFVVDNLLLTKNDSILLSNSETILVDGSIVYAKYLVP
ncbi:MAG: hypothetical protein ACPG4Y_05045 [Chitinophagales bacterium]